MCIRDRNTRNSPDTEPTWLAISTLLDAQTCVKLAIQSSVTHLYTSCIAITRRSSVNPLCQAIYCVNLRVSLTLMTPWFQDRCDLPPFLLSICSEFSWPQVFLHYCYIFNWDFILVFLKIKIIYAPLFAFRSNPETVFILKLLIFQRPVFLLKA